MQGLILWRFQLKRNGCKEQEIEKKEKQKEYNRELLTLNFAPIPAHTDAVMPDLHRYVLDVVETIRTRVHRTPSHTVWSYTAITSITH